MVSFHDHLSLLLPWSSAPLLVRARPVVPFLSVQPGQPRPPCEGGSLPGTAPSPRWGGRSRAGRRGQRGDRLPESACLTAAPCHLGVRRRAAPRSLLGTPGVLR